METEEQLTNLIQHLKVTYNTLNHFTTTTSADMVFRCNLEYTKKFIYERLETAVGRLNRVRAFKDDKTALHSTIRGGMEEWKASTMTSLLTHSTMVGTGQIPRGHIQNPP